MTFPARIANYDVLEKVGEGGMGVVYRALDVRLNRIVALKLLSAPMRDSEAAGIRLLHEAQALSALSHPQIATIYGVEEWEDRPVLVLEYLGGGTLLYRVRQARALGTRFRPEEIAAYALQIGDALACAHRNGIIHRDVKTANVMFSSEGLLKLTDFGLAKFHGAAEVTATGTTVGTAAYMSPEQVVTGTVDHRSDIFSFGMVLYECAAGELPFPHTSDATALYHIVHTEFPRLAGLRTDLPPAFSEIVAKALEKKPEDRYQSMDHLLADLRAGIAPGEAARPTITLHHRLPRRRRRRVRRWLPWAAVLAVLAVLALLLRAPVSSLWMPQQRQLAVLPFENVGGDAANQAFCDGVVETLASKLTQLEQFHGALWVVPASEVRRENALSARQARQAFGANLAITGSLQRTGGTLRLSMNLVDAKTLRQLRSVSLDGQVGSLAAWQDEVVIRAAEMLQVQLNGKAQAVLAAGGTKVPAAYDGYLKARGLLGGSRAEDLNLAVTLLRDAVELDPRFALAHSALGEAYWRKHFETKDAQWLPPAEAHCLKAVGLDRGLAPAHLSLGAIYRGTGRYDEAVREFRTALEIDPASAEAYTQLAAVYASVGKIEDAEAMYRQAVDLRPSYAHGHMYLGVFFYRQGRHAEAEAAFRRVIELVPESHHGYRNLGGLYQVMGRYEEAVKALRKSIAIRPNAAAYNNLGTVNYFLGRFPEAVEAFEKAVGGEGALNYLYWGNLADAYRHAPGLAAKARESYARAIELAARQIAINPKNADALSSMAVYHAKLGETELARKSLARAHSLEPRRGSVLFKTAIVEELSGRRSEAVKALAAAAAAGYSQAEIRSEPELKKLHEDSR